MKKIISQFFANIRRSFFNWRVNWEIFHQISPHLRKEADHGYSFNSQDAMVKLHVRGNLHANLNLRLIERTAAKMPKFQGDAFRFVAYRDLNQRMEMYLELAEQCTEPASDEGYQVATHA